MYGALRWKELRGFESFENEKVDVSSLISTETRSGYTDLKVVCTELKSAEEPMFHD